MRKILALLATLLSAAAIAGNPGIITGLYLGTGTSIPSAYAGTSCTNQFPRSLNASGVATCNTIQLGTDVAGTLLATNFPALTGDITTPGGSLVATLPTIVVAGTNTKITFNAKGQVTGSTAATLASADFANQGTTTTVLHGNAAGNPSFSAVALATDVSGTLPPQNGGTGVANNSASTITISGNFPTTFTVTGATGLTLPTSGTVTAQGNSVTGSGSVVLQNSPALVTPSIGNVQLTPDTGRIGNNALRITNSVSGQGGQLTLLGNGAMGSFFRMYNTGDQTGTNVGSIDFNLSNNSTQFQTSPNVFGAGTQPTNWAINMPRVLFNTTTDDGSNAVQVNGNTKVTGTLNATTALQVNGSSILPSLSGTTGSIGGGALVAGTCTSGTVAVTNATTSMVAAASPNTYPGDGSYWLAYVSAAGTVTVKVCAVIALTPSASTYNVRVMQ